MLSEACGTSEGFATVLAFIGLLTHMDSFVSSYIMTVIKGFLTFIALVGFFPTMYSLVFHKR